ncbi:MAG: hypothetical protein PHQ35_04145 [Phycisphaerae bacterium]|nr:hypothetical protein [Phycisphaerae bacterium]MDD5380290.1 hypothetical protein [Phycisphaerae bacterium]
MTKAHELSNIKNDAVKKRPVLRKTVIIVLVLIVLTAIIGVAALIHNNVSFTSDEVFAEQMDTAIASAEKWVSSNKMDILERRNIGLLKMLRECDAMKPNPVFEEIVKSFLAARCQPECWKRLIDPNWPVNEMELNQTIKNENTDNKWVLYAMAPDKAKITPEEMHLFEPERWRGRKLAHQLDALTALRKTKGATKQLDELIEHLSNRVSNELFFDVLKIDIGQVAFVLRAGFPEKINRRWVERIVASQLPDGGWNNRWCYFVSERRSVFDFSIPPSNQHDTLLALTVLYLARYEYPEHFGLK